MRSKYKILMLIGVTACVFASLFVCKFYGNKSKEDPTAEKYQQAIAMENNGNMLDAYEVFSELGDYKDSEVHAEELLGIMNEFAEVYQRALDEKSILDNAINAAETVLDESKVYTQSESKRLELSRIVNESKDEESILEINPVTTLDYKKAISEFESINVDEKVERITSATRNLEASTVYFGVIQPENLYCNAGKFSVNAADAVKRLPTESPLGTLKITGKILYETVENGIPVYVVKPGASVSFVYDNITDLTGDLEEGKWKITSSTHVKSAGDVKFKEGLKRGGIYIQKSYDGEIWVDAPYTRVNSFEEYRPSLGNFYSVNRADISNGCYYRIRFFYEATKKLDSKKIFGNSDKEYCTEEYIVYLLADESITSTPHSDSVQIYADYVRSHFEFGGLTLANLTTASRVAGEEVFHASQGRGFAAEAANMNIEAIKGLLRGERITHVGSDNVKNGADYLIKSADGMLLIQSKYCKTASDTIGACFENGIFRYSGMHIEVPADQFDDAVRIMESKIENGLIPGVSDKQEAANIIKKGAVTYKQAVNLAKAGTIESLTYDAYTGSVSAASAFGVSVVAQFAASIWNGNSIDAALQDSVYIGLKVGGNAFITSVVASQLSRSGLNSSLAPTSDAIIKLLGPKAASVIANAGRSGMKPLYGAAAMNHASKLLRGNIITSGVSLIVCTVPDAVEIFQGRISAKQMLKDFATNAGGVSGGMIGATGGAALGSAIFPGVGTAIGGVIGGIAGGAGLYAGVDALADLIAEDDAEEMLELMSMEFQNLAEEYLMTEDEADKVMASLQDKLNTGVLKDMYAATTHNEFAIEFLEPLFEEVVRGRQYIEIPNDEEMKESLVFVLENISEDKNIMKEAS